MKVGGSLLYVTDGWAYKNTNLNVWQYQCWSFTLSVYLKDFVLKTYFLKKGSFEIPIWTFEGRGLSDNDRYWSNASDEWSSSLGPRWQPVILDTSLRQFQANLKDGCDWEEMPGADRKTYIFKVDWLDLEILSVTSPVRTVVMWGNVCVLYG